MRATFVVPAALLVTTMTATGAAAGPAQGLGCGLVTSTSESGESGVVTGGPVAFTGELATAVIYRCTIVVTGPDGTWQATYAHESAGPVGYLPPVAVTFGAVPGSTTVTLCTEAEWIFGFPGSGSVHGGCQEATYRDEPAPGYLVTPVLVQ